MSWRAATWGQPGGFPQRPLEVSPSKFEASPIGTLQQKMTLGHLDKNDQKWPIDYPLGVSFFQKSSFFLKNKESTATQEEQGSKRGRKIWVVCLVQTEIVLSCTVRKVCRAQTEHSAQKKGPKIPDFFRTTFCTVRTENWVLLKNWKFDGNFQSKTQILVKTS